MAVFWTLSGCKEDKPVPPPPVAKPAIPEVAAPIFNSDSAFAFVQKQVEFGPRVPNTEGHRQCAAWLAATFRRHGLTVVEQKFQAQHYQGQTFNCVNIIGQYKPENPRRVMLAAHWDSRFMADQDVANKNKPILGADDGGSGVGVLLEIARLLKEQPLDIGVDFVLFDAEDQGNDADDNQDHSLTWCLGAQYWSKNPHQPNYSPLYGILLDMVGGADPRFLREGVSMHFAPAIVDMVWSVAGSLNYDSVFVQKNGQPITDDHLFVNRDARIPMIDIISVPGKSKSGFVTHWHTHNDNLKAIDKNTLRIVGEVVTATIYRTPGMDL
jgi:glutaminyl-peptide cyclotransferase